MADTNVYHIVKWRDTLTSIAEKYNTTVEEICKLNNITNPDLIAVGQKLLISGDGTGSGSGTGTGSGQDGNAVTITSFGLLATSDRTIFVTWDWTKENTENYRVIWRYQTTDKNDAGERIWFTGSDSTTSNEDTRESTYNAPENAVAVKVKIKPNAKTGSANGAATSSWTGAWSTEKVYKFENALPMTFSSPSVKIEKYKLTAELDNLEPYITHVEFEVVRNHNEVVYRRSAKCIVSTRHISYVTNVEAGAKYKVRCRVWQDDVNSDWSDYSQAVNSLPTTPVITKCETASKTSANLEWSKIHSAEQYEIQYTKKKENFDNLGGDVSSLTVADDTEDNETTISRVLLNLETGSEYFLRIRAANDNDVSEWSEISTFIIGTKPTSPTIWTTAEYVMIGEPLNFYWIHNSKDGSSQTWAELELTINDSSPVIHTIKNSTDEEEKDKTSVYEYDTNVLSDGQKIKWRVRTAGVTTNQNGDPEYGDWSMTKTVNVYAPPTLGLYLQDSNGTVIDRELTSLPFAVNLSAGNTANQQPTGYYITISSNENYKTTDNIGNDMNVIVGGKVYSKHIDSTDTSLSAEVSANDLTLENNVTYTVTCVVSMNSGLRAEASTTFKVAWSNTVYIPDAVIGIDKDSVSAYIRPYSNGNTDDLLSVYRREYDGSFTEIATNLTNSSNTYVTDPHPALDYARYRIISKNIVNGAVSYNDIPGIPVGVKSVVIQWDEAWQNFDTSEDTTLAQQPWAGSMLKLPYNIDVSEQTNPDVSLIEYIGRKHPVSYYGTQLRGSATWSVEIPKSDKETLYALRRLSMWMGNVYVREPSGSGYWANIKVSFSQKHLGVTIPVSLNISRVEGGM